MTSLSLKWPWYDVRATSILTELSDGQFVAVVWSTLWDLLCSCFFGLFCFALATKNLSPSVSPPALEQVPMQNLVYSQKYQESHLWRSDCRKLSQQGNSCLFLRNSPTQFPLKKHASFPIVNNFVYGTLVYTSAATKQKLITRSGNGNKKNKNNCSAFILNVWNPLFPSLCPWHSQQRRK